MAGVGQLPIIMDRDIATDHQPSGIYVSCSLSLLPMIDSLQKKKILLAREKVAEILTSKLLFFWE